MARSYTPRVTAPRPCPLCPATARGWWSALGAGWALPLLACGSSPEVAAPPAVAVAEVGFVEIAADDYSLGDATLTSPPARLFYDYQPALSDTDTAPLLVVTGGGPGAAVLLLAMDTATSGLIGRAEAGLLLGPHATPFTDLGHVLYVDARNTGYSYALATDPSVAEERAAGLGPASSNVFRDAADVLHVLLAFLSDHPALSACDVVLVAESYGGARTAVLVDLLLGAGERPGRSGPFASAVLAEALAAPLGEGDAAPLRGWDLGSRVRGQLLLQPIIAGALQDEVTGDLLEAEGSVLDAIAAETGIPFVRCAEREPPCEPFANVEAFLVAAGRSQFDHRAPLGWLDGLLGAAGSVGGDLGAAALVLGVSEAELVAALGDRAPGAYRFVDQAAASDGSLAAAAGPLEAWDAYFTPLNRDVLDAFWTAEVRDLDAHADASVLPGLFVDNLRSVPTLVTRARYDLHVFAPALPGVLARLPGVVAVTERGAEALALTLDDGAEVVLQAPRFEGSSHAIASDEPAALSAALAAWMAEIHGAGSP